MRIVAVVMGLVIAVSVGAAPWRPIGAPNWQPVGESNGLATYYDANSVQKVGHDIAKAWTLWSYNAPQTIQLQTYYSSRNLVFFNCASRTAAEGSSFFYSKADGRGDVVWSAEVPDAAVTLSAYSDVAPETIQAALFNVVCAAAMSG